MREKEYVQSEARNANTEDKENLEKEVDFYTETFTSKYSEHRNTFLSIWNKEKNIVNEPNLNAAQKATATVIHVADGALATYSKVTGFTSQLSDALMLPLLRTVNFTQGIGCLPVCKQMDPVINLFDIHLVSIPPSLAPIPMIHPFIGFSFRPKDFLALAVITASVMVKDGLDASVNQQVEFDNLSEENGKMINDTTEFVTSFARIFISNLGATVKMGMILPRTVAGTPIKSIKHVPFGAGFHAIANAIKKDHGHAWVGSMFVLADGSPLVGAPHLQNVCSDFGLTSIHDAGSKPDPEKGVQAKLYMPSGIIIPIPWNGIVLTNPVPCAINPVQIPRLLMRAGFTKLKTMRAKKVKDNTEKEKPCSTISRALNRANEKIFNTKYTKGLYSKIDKKLKTYVGHPVDVVGGDLFTDSIDFKFSGIIPLSFERVWYSDSEYLGPLGHGWHHSYDRALFINLEHRRAQARLWDGRLINFDKIPTREHPKPRYHRSEKLWLCYHEDGYYYLKNQKEELYLFHTKAYMDRQEAYLLSAICNQEGFTIRFTYNSKGILTEIKDTVNRIYLFESDEEGHLTKVWTEGLEGSATKVCIAEYVYNNQGDMITHYDEMRQPLQMQYNRHLLIKETWRNGHQWFFKYEGNKTGSRCIETWGDGGIQHFKLAYYQGETHVIDGEANKTIYKHQNKLVYETLDANGGVWKKMYNKYSELDRSIDSLGHVHSFIRDDYGNITKIILPDGQFTQINYKESDYPYLPTEHIDAKGGVWQYFYNREGRIREMINPLQAKTKWKYNAEGLLVSILSGLGVSTQLEYDKQYNLSAISSPTGNRTRYQYDLWNRCTHTINANGIQQKRILDRLGRAVAVHDFDGTIIQLKYDALNNIIEYEDQNRHIHFKYKGIHKLIWRSEAGNAISYSYDSNERLREIKNEEGHIYQFGLDAIGNVLHEKAFDDIEKRFKRNEVGWITTIQRPDNRWTHYEYDEMGRVTQVKYSDKSCETYTYESGLLSQAINEAGVLSLQYDVLGQVIEERFNTKKVQSTYDAYGRRTNLSSSLGANLEHRFDALNNRIESHFNDWKVHKEYDSFGRENLRIYSGGIQQAWEYDKIGRVKEQRIHRLKCSNYSVPHFYRQYIWDQGGLLCQITDQGVQHTYFQHDKRDFLQGVIYQGNEKIERGVDASGNLYKQLDCKDRSYKINRLEETKTAKYQYDREGNLVEKIEKLTGKNWTYQWNGAGMLSRVISPEGDIVDFQYDALGRRVSKCCREATTHYVWEGDVVLHEYKTFDVNASTTDDIITWVFEQDSFVPMAKIKGEKKYSLVTDHLGTPILGYSDRGEKIWERELDSFGKARMTVGDEEFCNYLYQGQMYDKETGLAYNRFRYYDPEIGNYISQDPIGLEGGNPTLYGYVGDPTICIDVFGLDLTDQMTFREAFRRAKQQLRIPRHISKPEAVFVFDKQYENRTVWAFGGDHKGKYIIMHQDDKFGRGAHLHTADGAKGDPKLAGKYNQHRGHIPENSKGLSNVQKHTYQ